MQSEAGLNRVPKKVLEEVPRGFGAEPGQVQRGLEGFGAEPGQVQQGSGEGSGEGLGGFGAEPVQQGSGEDFGQGLGGFGTALGFAARIRKICKNRTFRR